MFAQGTVEVEGADSVATGTWIGLGKWVKTGPSSAVKLLLSDRSIIDMGAESQFEITQSRGGSGPGRRVDAQLKYGKIRGAVTEKIGKGGSFQIRTQGTTMGVRGTEFVIQAPMDFTSGQAAPPQIAVLQGNVEIASGGQNTPSNLGAGQVWAAPVAAVGADARAPASGGGDSSGAGSDAAGSGASGTGSGSGAGSGTPSGGAQGANSGAAGTSASGGSDGAKSEGAKADASGSAGGASSGSSNAAKVEAMSQEFKAPMNLGAISAEAVESQAAAVVMQVSARPPENQPPPAPQGPIGGPGLRDGATGTPPGSSQTTTEVPLPAGGLDTVRIVIRR